MRLDFCADLSRVITDVNGLRPMIKKCGHGVVIHENINCAQGKVKLSNSSGCEPLLTCYSDPVLTRRGMRHPRGSLEMGGYDLDLEELES